METDHIAAHDRLTNLALNKLDTHEQICTLRYKNIEADLARIIATIRDNRDEDKDHIKEVFEANQDAIEESRKSIDEIKSWFKWMITSILGASGTVAIALLFKGVL